jgi:P-type conjugative transfer protein TrbJ
MQSKIAETVRADTSVLDTLMRESQGAGGNLAAAQAGNQILALSAKQTMQLQELTASQFRAETLERARRLQIERAAKVRHSRFVGGSTAYSDN